MLLSLQSTIKVIPIELFNHILKFDVNLQPPPSKNTQEIRFFFFNYLIHKKIFFKPCQTVSEVMKYQTQNQCSLCRYWRIYFVSFKLTWKIPLHLSKLNTSCLVVNCTMFKWYHLTEGNEKSTTIGQILHQISRDSQYFHFSSRLGF